MENKTDGTRRREKISDGCLVGGAIAVSVGIGLFHIAAGIIAGGILAILYGWLISQGGDQT